MTGSGTGRIPLTELVLGRSLGKGGQGEVWAVEKRKINNAWPMAYKEYNAAALKQLHSDALERMVAFLPAQPHHVGRWLAETTAWPAALVTAEGRVRGFLMRQIPSEFFLTVPSGQRKAAGFEFLLNSHGYVAKVVGRPVTPRQTFGLLLAVADLLERLHKLDIVAGDLSPKNLLFSLSGLRPSCFLIDCDAMGVGGGWALKPVQTPGWQLPGSEPADTRQGDAYKFALLATRLFLHEQDGQDTTALAGMDRTLGRLAERGLSRTPADRPALADWLDPLRQAVDRAPATWPGASRPPGPRRPTGGTAGTGSATAGGATAGRGTTKAAAAGATSTMRITGPGTGRVGAGTGGTGGTGGAAGPSATRTHATRPQPVYVPSSPPARSPAGTGGGAKAALWGVVLVLIAVAAGWFVVRELGSGSDGAGGGDTPATRQEQAAALDAMLSENAGRRSGVSDAVQSMMKCSGLRDARQVFTDAADARVALVGRLDGMDLDQLSAGLVSDLRTAWTNSEKADRAYARVVDTVSGHCTSSAVVHSKAWRDASAAGDRATAAKKHVVAVWNPLAEEFGLGTRAWTDL